MLTVDWGRGANTTKACVASTTKSETGKPETGQYAKSLGAHRGDNPDVVLVVGHNGGCGKTESCLITLAASKTQPTSQHQNRVAQQHKQCSCRAPSAILSAGQEPLWVSALEAIPALKGRF